ncbi:hypothetical protein DL95DRAFT_376840 [Leptodontidium sp. 2 PMI_412]|nr:hypothetical protein DL95DRAFT_376840 [Leptodontidium sp. 2 PMI_412]
MSPQSPQFELKTYEYEPLPSPLSIRLLSFVKQRDNGPTVCGTPLMDFTLRTVDLTTSPAYKALSYTWGNPYSTFASPRDRETYAIPSGDQYDGRHQWPLAVNGRIHFVARNLLEALQRLFLEGAPTINQSFPPFNKTTLIRASETNQPDRVLRCLRLGADIHLKDRFGETALHYAAENGHIEVVKILLRYGAEDQIRDKSGRIPLDCCLQRKRGQHREVAELLRNTDSSGNRSKDMLAYTREPDNQLYDLWVDAICINQSDVAERTAQVALMSRIYSTALSVVVWLGPEDISTHFASLALEGETVTEKQLFDIRNLISRSWFTRKWVIQEISLAKAIEVWCGSFRINLDCLLGYGLERISPVGKLLESPPTKLSQGRKGLGVWEVLVLRHWLSQIQSPPLDCTNRILPPSMPALIALTWHFESKDPRDRIFALLGIVSKYPLEENPCDLVADYSMSTDDVFLKAGRHFVEAKGQNEIPHWNKKSEILEPLEGLSFIQHELLVVGNMPSWVPDFRLELRTARLWDCRFSAGGPRCNIWPSDSRLLKVDGHLLDRVTEAEYQQRMQKDKLPTSVPDIAAWFRIALSLEFRYQNACHMSRAEVLWRTLIADNTCDNHPCLTKESFKDFLCQHMQKSRENPDQFSIQTDLLSRLHADEESQSLPSIKDIGAVKLQKAGGCGSATCSCKKEKCKFGSFHESFQILSSYRQLFRTEQAYLGLGPRAAIAGDQIWLIAGARTPFIMRPVSDAQAAVRFRLVGECYVHGVMHGEAVGRGEMIFKPIEIE